ncbi:MAG: transporter [Verrucomicrobia bacterium]|nr:transporter [Verrucomicrobiota bacterium]
MLSPSRRWLPPLLLVLAARPAMAGPPLTVDDSETLKAREVELFVSAQVTRTRGGGTTWEAPMELTIGLGQGFECSLATGWSDVRLASGGGEARGVLALDPGLKWSFRPPTEGRMFSAALGLKLHVPIRRAAVLAGVGGYSMTLNLATTWDLGFANADLNVGIGHVTASAGARARQEILLGAAIRKELVRERWTVFAEAYATQDRRRFASAEVRADLGVLLDVSPKLRFSLLAGRGFRDDGADYFCNFGILFSLGSNAVKPAVIHAAESSSGRDWQAKVRAPQ